MYGASKLQLPGLISELIFKDEHKKSTIFRIIHIIKAKHASNN